MAFFMRPALRSGLKGLRVGLVIAVFFYLTAGGWADDKGAFVRALAGFVLVCGGIGAVSGVMVGGRDWIEANRLGRSHEPRP